MTIGDVVRILGDPLYGWAPVGAIDSIVRDWARVVFDQPGHWGRAYGWFRLEELEVIDLARWETATGDAA
jgi:hypothetical protein